MHYRDTQLEISMDNAFHNIDCLKSLNCDKKVKAIVKANAYGHGLVSFSYILEKYKKVDSFGVSNLDEALALRKNGITLPILVMGAVDNRHFIKALENDVTITVYCEKVALDVLKFNKPLKIQFKIDTGMNRIGFKKFDTFVEMYDKIKESNIIVEGIYSHFSSADEDEDFSLHQIEEFRKYANVLPKSTEIHIQNTAGCINYPNIDYVNTIRPGIGLFGFNPVSNKSHTYKEIYLKELITLKSKIVLIKDVHNDDTIGYNRTHKITKNTKIATVPLGYADGFKLCYGQSFAYIEKNGIINKYPICGKVCMDQMMIEVSENEKIGDYLTFIGEYIKISDLSRDFLVSPYEAMTSLSERLFKVYKYNGKTVRYDNQIFKS